ncbi:transglycosylase SLT domain-containing protein [Acetobacteraceae bacterium ESL0709]|nr:transglycosylase SLT domain-containing protein [Acetobacteraceae bacterium ESL0697]MDF7678115.1 transglycosylase SLT domain-containing protein [Acetobacteraceae bacterium ESL0709]
MHPAAASALQLVRVPARLNGNETISLSGQKRNSVSLGLVPDLRVKTDHTAKAVTPTLPQKTEQKKLNDKIGIFVNTPFHDVGYGNFTRIINPYISKGGFSTKRTDDLESKHIFDKNNIKESSLRGVPLYKQPLDKKDNFYVDEPLLKDIVNGRIKKQNYEGPLPLLYGKPETILKHQLTDRINLERLVGAQAYRESKADTRVGFEDDKSGLKQNQYEKGHHILGLMQLKFSTAHEKAGLEREDLLEDPEISWQVTKHYMASLLKRYHGNLDYALAAYHEGEQGLTNAMTKAALHHDSAHWENYLRPAAKQYISNVESTYNDGPVVLITHPGDRRNNDESNNKAHQIDDLRRAAVY